MMKLFKNQFFEVLSRQDLKNIVGGSMPCDGEDCLQTLCKHDELGLCGGNCIRKGGAADKCKPKGSECTCGGL